MKIISEAMNGTVITKVGVKCFRDANLLSPRQSKYTCKVERALGEQHSWV